MPTTMHARAVLDRCFLEMRAKILEVGAMLDRVDRAEGGQDVRSDDRLRKLTEAASALVDGKADRAARIQMIFSDAYDPHWQRPRA